MVDESHPTLLFDEVDTIFTTKKNSDPAKTELIGLIDAGFRRSPHVPATAARTGPW